MIVKRMVDLDELEQAAGDICRGYCRYPLIWDEDAMQMELSESDICASCPLTELLKGTVIETEASADVDFV